MSDNVVVNFKNSQTIFEEIFTPSKKLEMTLYIKREMDPFTPYDTGRLYSTAVIRESSVTYPVKYAADCYYINRNYKRDKHRYATSHWDSAMMNIKNESISKRLQEMIDKK